MHPVNELFMNSMDAEKALTSLREERNAAYQKYTRASRQGDKDAQAAAEKDLDRLNDEIVEADRKAIEAKRAHILYKERLAAEDAELLKRPSGRIADGYSSTPPVREKGGVNLRFAELFGAPPSLSAEGWERGAGDFFASLAAGLHHPSLRPAASAFNNEATGSEGGFLVPGELVARAFDQAIEAEPVLQRVLIEPMTSNTKTVAGFSSSDHSSTAPYGFSGGWIAEGAEMSVEKALVRAVKLVSKKLALLCQASSEVAADGASFEAQLENAMRTALSWKLADAVFNGTGAGQPLGVLAAPCTVSCSKEVGQAADTFTFENSTAMLARLLPSAQARAAWFMSHTVRPQAMRLSVTVGTGGSYVPLTQVGSQLYLHGLPLFFTEHLPVLGDAGDVLLGDFANYVLGVRSQLTLDKSQHVGFTKDLQTYRALVRADGLPLLDAPFTPKVGSTLGAFVKLEAR